MVYTGLNQDTRAHEDSDDAGGVHIVVVVVDVDDDVAKPTNGSVLVTMIMKVLVFAIMHETFEATPYTLITS